jgi:hypothetical protein
MLTSRSSMWLLKIVFYAVVIWTFLIVIYAWHYFAEHMDSFSQWKICHQILVFCGELNSLLFFVDVGYSNTKYGVWHLDWYLFHFNCRYFFAEVFDFFRSFFMIVFHLNILFMILPLAIRLKHRPCFLAFIYIAISSMLKSYPSVSCLLFSSALHLYTLT